MLRKTYGVAGDDAGDFGASMRPQRNAAENRALQGYCQTILAASMRPQRNAAENAGVTTGGGAASESFNEAAA